MKLRIEYNIMNRCYAIFDASDDERPAIESGVGTREVAIEAARDPSGERTGIHD